MRGATRPATGNEKTLPEKKPGAARPAKGGLARRQAMARLRGIPADHDGREENPSDLQAPPLRPIKPASPRKGESAPADLHQTRKMSPGQIDDPVPDSPARPIRPVRPAGTVGEISFDLPPDEGSFEEEASTAAPLQEVESSEPLSGEGSPGKNNAGKTPTSRPPEVSASPPAPSSRSPIIRQGRVSPEEREAERQRREKLRQQRSQARQKKAEEERERLLRSSERRQRRVARREKRREERKKARERKTRQKAEALISAAAAPERRSWIEKSWLRHLNRQPEAPAFLREQVTALSRKIERLRQERSRKRWLDVVGLDIGASSIRAALFRPGREPFLIEREIPEGIIIDGILAEPEELSEELKAMWKENQMPSRKVNFSFANRLIAVRAISLPAQDSEDIEQAIALNAAPIVSPMNPETTAIDYAELSRTGPQVSLQVGAADIEMSRAFLEAIEGAGLWAASAEVGPLALNRSLVVPRSASGSHGIIDIGAETTKVTVASGPDIFFVRVLETGGNDFTRALAERTGRGWAEAEELKYRSGVGSEPVDPGLSRAEFARCSDAMQTVCDSLCQEVLQAQSSFERSESGKRLPVSGYTLIGGGSRLAGIGEQMAFLLGRPVTDEIRPWPGLEEFDLVLWSPALGLARDHKMSLLPPRRKRGIPRRRRESKISADRAEDRAKELAPKRKAQLVNPWLAGMVLLALLILGSFFLGGKFGDDAATNRSEIASLQQAEAVSRQATGEAEAEAIINLVSDSPDWELLEKATEQAATLGNQAESIETRAGTVYVYLRGRSSALELRQTIGLDDDIEIEDTGDGRKLLVVDGGGG